MTRYTIDELDSDWEFKIVRSEIGAFRKPEVFAALLQEESLAGWEMVEKLDDRRVRFKRRSDARRRDATFPQGMIPTAPSTAGHLLPGRILVMIALLLAVGVAVVLFWQIRWTAQYHFRDPDRWLA